MGLQFLWLGSDDVWCCSVCLLIVDLLLLQGTGSMESGLPHKKNNLAKGTTKDIFDGLHKLVQWCEKCIQKESNCVEKLHIICTSNLIILHTHTHQSAITLKPCK